MNNFPKIESALQKLENLRFESDDYIDQNQAEKWIELIESAQRNLMKSFAEETHDINPTLIGDFNKGLFNYYPAFEDFCKRLLKSDQMETSWWNIQK